MKVRPHANILVAKPVHPTAIRHHGLFGIPFVRQHMVVDDRWTPNSLTEQFKGMSDLLAKRLVFKKLESNANRQTHISEYRKLRRQVQDGRTKLQMTLHGDNTKKVRKYLINHKDMQRLYQKMPVHLVVDNIDQRTFVLRKERDRLRFRLDTLKEEYEKKLHERAMLETRITYEDMFVLEEDERSREFRKKIENSTVRLRAIKTINTTYKKMIQVLRHDGIFYEPILQSLDKDIEDQSNFIKHILYLGTPAITKFKELTEQYRKMEDKSRKALQNRLAWVSKYKKPAGRLMSVTKEKAEPAVHDLSTVKRYVRETDSMLKLKNELEAIEITIKQVKFATLCSRANEIYPRMKSQVDNNKKLQKSIENNTLGHQDLDTKMKRAEVLEGVLINNLSEEEIIRLNRIKELKVQIALEDEIEAKTKEHMKNRADTYVVLRYTLWNLNEILRHVDRPGKASRFVYPNAYLMLPLLKFEMLTMRAVPPDVFEQNIDEILRNVKRKVQLLMQNFPEDSSPATIAPIIESYHKEYLEYTEDIDDYAENADADQQNVGEEDDLLETKTLQNVPNRKQIKAQSAKLVEESAKKELA